MAALKPELVMSNSENFGCIEKLNKTPAAVKSKYCCGSKVIVDLLRRCELPNSALNRWGSYRCLHDSNVDYGGTGLTMMFCQYAETAVLVAVRTNTAIWLRNAFKCLKGTVTTFIRTAMWKPQTPSNGHFKKKPKAMNERWTM